MTGTRDPQQDGSIQAMLRDSGLETSVGLRSSLEELRALVPDQAPAPRADLAALLAAGTNSPSAAGATLLHASPSVEGTLPPGIISLADRRRSRKRSLAIVGGAVIGAMSLGAGAVAASSEDFRHSVSQTVGVIFQPSGHAPAPTPEHAQPSPAEVPAVPAAPTAAAPAAASPAAASPAGGTSGSPAAPAPSAPQATPPAIGRGGVLPTPGQRPVTPGVPGLPGPGDGPSLPHGPAPVAPALPGVVPTKLPGQP